VAHAPNLGLVHFQWQALATLVFPYLYGPLNQSMWVGGEHLAMGATLIFLVLAGFFELVRSPHRGATAVAISAVLAGGKLFGVPGINDIGRLPPVERFWFVYAIGPLAICVCVLAGFGLRYVLRAGDLGLRRLAIAWAALVVLLLGIGVYTLHQHAPALGANVVWLRDCLEALAIGVFWAGAIPLALFLLRARSSSAAPLLAMTVAALVTQSLAYLPNGSPRGHIIVNIGAAIVFIVVAGLLVAWPRPLGKGIALLVTAAAVTVVTFIGWIRAPGLPTRYDPLTPAPYVRMLEAFHNAPRIYGFDGALFPNYAAPLGLTSVTNLEVITPRQVTEFFWKYLDPGVDPPRFYGTMAQRMPGARPPHVEFLAHKRYWDLIGTRYLLAVGTPIDGTVVVDASPEGMAGTPVPVSQPLQATVSCAAGWFQRVRVPLGTYMQVQLGQVTLEIVDEKGTTLGAAAVDSATLIDNGMTTFRLGAPVCTDRRSAVTLRLSYRADRPGAIVAAWRYPTQPDTGFAFELFQPSSDIVPITEDRSTGIRIYENRTAFERAFLAPHAIVVSDWRAALARLADTPDLGRTVYIEQREAAACQGLHSAPATGTPGRLRSIAVDANHVNVAYRAAVPGVLTLTDAWLRGWHARVNGREVPLLRVDGVFRGVCLDAPGEYMVTFYYRPALWYASLALSALGIVIIGGSLLISARTDVPRGPRRR
jgi:hypothetical protein